VTCEQARIAFLIPTLDSIGGAERQVLLLSRGLASRGLQVTVITLSGSRPSDADLDSDRIEFLSLGMRKAWVDWGGWVRYLRWHRAHQPDIVHAHLPHAVWFARFVRVIAPVRVVLETIHTSKAPWPFHCLCRRVTAPLASYTTCVSQAVADSALQAGLVSRSKMTVLANGVELPPLPTSAIPAAAGEFRWLAIGRLAPVKDYPTLLRAMSLLPPQTSLTIAGSGPEEAALRDLATSLELGSRVHFAGFQADTRPLLCRSDALVLSSLWEGLPMNLLEAAAAGLPVVATRGAGTPEALIEGVTGYLVPPANPLALADSMLNLMSLPAASRRAMGQRGREFVAQNFSLEVILDSWLQLYVTLLESRPRAKRWG
jgi:glycosyltransferase involved in cell wall biosynthesis